MRKENIALKKPTWQASTYGKFTSDRAVDGLAKNLSSVGYQCSISNNLETKAEWRVNLENILSIRYILIFYRTENIRWDSNNPFTSRFLGFSLYISNTTNKNEGHLCFHDTNYTIDTIPSIANISCPVHGQYVIYYNERLDERTYPSNYSQYAFSELCEVKVFGCPEPGYYGDACSIRCPYLNCGYCHIETGQCLECKPGYQGNQCASVCGRGFYGKRCSESCGNCSYGETCHPIHGFCTNRCHYVQWDSMEIIVPCPVATVICVIGLRENVYPNAMLVGWDRYVPK
ncbi:cell death abnormality protein 1-like, partial [Saccostrea cucullata]|uniref:cell death abnormality protein 1-like n=1 Tax=Saccostrea cuccullata TaxID=36930 RepID=UPI002ED15058